MLVEAKQKSVQLALRQRGEVMYSSYAVLFKLARRVPSRLQSGPSLERQALDIGPIRYLMADGCVRSCIHCSSADCWQRSAHDPSMTYCTESGAICKANSNDATEAIERPRRPLSGWVPCPCFQLFATTHYTAGTDEVRHCLNEECEVCHKPFSTLSTTFKLLYLAPSAASASVTTPSESWCQLPVRKS
ncbi:MAG: hypothetical protein J3Q66DRAFT_367240 [Benniella sp.]|nr:MAG: hypothetical protein J3Q66DRAFT_367240 [Benniella sp.]